MFTGFQFRHAYYLYMLTMIVPLGMLFYWLIERRRQQFVRLMGDSARARADRAVHHYRIRALLMLLATAMGIIALARPQWGEYQDIVQTKGIDVIIAVDVSLSMLAEDEQPSRLARARRLGADLIDRLHDNRIGLIAFAESSASLMPLTLDSAALKTFVDALDARTVDDQGTSIAEAIHRATQSFKTIGKQSRVLIIISDGEDLSDSPLDSVREAALEAANNGVMIVTVGVGSDKGVNIPLAGIGASGIKLDADSKPVVTKLDESILQTAAETTQGIYLHAQPDGQEAFAISSFIEKLSKGEFRDIVTRDRQDRYQYPLGLALVFVITDMMLLLRRP